MFTATGSNAEPFSFGDFDSNEFDEFDSFEYGTATPSDAVSLETIHSDIQLLNYTVLMVFITVFVFSLVKKWR